MTLKQVKIYYGGTGRASMVSYNGTKYTYVHNLQGDIVGILDASGSLVVEYSYDAWGKPTAMAGGMAGTLGALNPFRYRGYVWDEETGLYYLRSRYYNPDWCRFINADNYMGKVSGTNVHNLYAYCVNVPVLKEDRNGFFAFLATMAAVAASVSAGDVLAAGGISLLGGMLTKLVIDTLTNSSDGSGTSLEMLESSRIVSAATATYEDYKNNLELGNYYLAAADGSRLIIAKDIPLTYSEALAMLDTVDKSVVLWYN